LQIKIKLENGEEAVYPQGTTCMDLYREKTAENKALLAVLVDGKECDLSLPLPESSTIAFIDFDTPQGASIYRHSASHVLAHAVKRLYPRLNLGIGPAIENGFYYDIEFGEPISADDLPAIEKEMKKILKNGSHHQAREMSREEALPCFNEK
jgi:threonyl-tRNA synthetase